MEHICCQSYITEFGVWVDNETYPDAKLPERKHDHDAGYDLSSAESYEIKPGEKQIVHTGLYFQIPLGWEIQIRPRSGLSAKKGVTVLNTPGTIDCLYRAEVMVILQNHGSETFKIEPKDRIAQAVFKQVPMVNVVELKEKPSENTDRGVGGFGSTGVK